MISKRQRRIAAKEELKSGDKILKEIDFSEMLHAPKWMTRCFRNNKYIVMIDDNANTTHGVAILAMVQNHTDTPIAGHWAELQNIKNIVFGKEATAIEYYPAESELVNQHNIYWLWIFPDGIIPKMTK